MLECVGVVLHIVIVVVGVGEEILAVCEYVGRRDVGRWQAEAFGMLDLVDLLCVVIQIFADLVP